MPSAAQRTLISQVAAAGARLRYHGDFDWPGLTIGNFVTGALGAQPWRFGADDYLAACQGGESRLSGGRIEAGWDPRLAAAMVEIGDWPYTRRPWQKFCWMISAGQYCDAHRSNFSDGERMRRPSGLISPHRI